MVEMIKSANKHLGFEVIAKNIKYFDDSIELLNCKSSEDAAFFKPRVPYQKEREYRIAIFFPGDEKFEIKTTDGYISIFNPTPSKDDHMTFNFDCPEFSQIVVGVHHALMSNK